MRATTAGTTRAPLCASRLSRGAVHANARLSHHCDSVCLLSPLLLKLCYDTHVRYSLTPEGALASFVRKKVRIVREANTKPGQGSGVK
jgi:hypothetical protein